MYKELVLHLLNHTTGLTFDRFVLPKSNQTMQTASLPSEFVSQYCTSFGSLGISLFKTGT